ncbi:carboxymethylenebutenolidase [Saccharibacillus endophyticus]|uniref:Carboxymethylenebutenolidase n=2 Tax=Saccharibacillus endophyticus TaxID=2060666 RepID=A0ABQ1ZZR6_9BACL|nr:carboxymethylenebutenolidase [Saccharibacillus endophyticus]
MLLYILSVFAIVILCVLFYYNRAFPEASQIAESMQKIENDYYFKGSTEVGFIIFSGAKVDEKAYSYIAKLLYEEGHTVVIPKVLFHMSATGTNRGLEIIEENPQIKKWFLIGHSLGGLPISRIAAQQPDKLQGIAFLASYMITDLSKIDVSAIRITANNDKIMNSKRMEEHLDYLPENSLSIEIDGNHKGFGAYDSLSRDGETRSSWKQQQEESVRLILDFFDNQINKDL